MLRKKSIVDNVVMILIGVMLLALACLYAFSEVKIPVEVYVLVWGTAIWQIFKRTDTSCI